MIAVAVLKNVRIMTGCDVIKSHFESPFEKETEFHAFVTENARVGRSSRKIIVDKRGDYIFFKFFAEIKGAS